MELGLIASTKQKQEYPCKARTMYSVSQLFSLAFEYAQKRYDEIGFLSAKYGLLLPDDQIQPYDIAIRSMTTAHRMRWADLVFRHIQEKFEPTWDDLVYFHTGKPYREFLQPKLEEIGIECIIPLEGKGIGQQIAWYREQLELIKQKEAL